MRRTRKSGQSKPRTVHRHLQCETLEPRSLLAIGAFTINLYEEVHGEPGALIEDASVRAGQEFFVEILAREYDPLIAGFGGIALDIAWDPKVLREVDTAFFPQSPRSSLVTSHFPVLRDGTLNNDRGTISNLSGYTFLATGTGRAIGDATAERFSLLKFRALADADSTTITLRQGKSSIGTVPVLSLDDADFYFELQEIRVSPRSVTSDAENLAVANPSIPFFVGPLTAEEYFGAPISVHEDAGATQILSNDILETGHDCWTVEPINAAQPRTFPRHSAIVLLESATRIAGDPAGPAEVWNATQLGAPTLAAVPEASQVGTAPETDEAIDSLLATEESLSLFDEMAWAIDELSFDRETH